MGAVLQLCAFEAGWPPRLSPSLAGAPGWFALDWTAGQRAALYVACEKDTLRALLTGVRPAIVNLDWRRLLR
ncbi:hypothetical protein [Streptomyces nanshensis]|uniref:Uncharacterized protein n=1 Tax=Streptomyces nanshensis TaxID=518642 RepID=A0A1E7KUH9_9ACTN|nr:hypothetical protein [Streptomyces nanshensis]OEV07586.1 hypothetical protein AN218_28990 [Streptomyces nanshensis]